MSLLTTPSQYLQLLAEIVSRPEIVDIVFSTVDRALVRGNMREAVAFLLQELYQQFKHYKDTVIKVSRDDKTRKLGGALRVGGAISVAHAVKLLGFAELVLRTYKFENTVPSNDILACAFYTLEMELGSVPTDDAWFFQFSQVLSVVVSLAPCAKKGDSVAIAAMLSDGKFYSMGKSKTAATKRRERMFELLTGKPALTAKTRYTGGGRKSTIGRKRSTSADDSSSVDLTPVQKQRIDYDFVGTGLGPQDLHDGDSFSSLFDEDHESDLDDLTDCEVSSVSSFDSYQHGDRSPSLTVSGDEDDLPFDFAGEEDVDLHFDFEFN